MKTEKEAMYMLMTMREQYNREKELDPDCCHEHLRGGVDALRYIVGIGLADKILKLVDEGKDMHEIFKEVMLDGKR
jgi:hypothetical protein